MKKTNKSGNNKTEQDMSIAAINKAEREWDAEAALHERDKGTYHALQHRGVERVVLEEDGKPSTVTKTVTTIRQLVLDGQISIEQHQVALEYKHWFDLAALDPIKAAPMDGMPRSGAVPRSPYDSARVEDARDRLASYHDALGGAGSRMSLAMYWSVGMERGFGGRKVSAAKRISRKENLFMALELLVWVNRGARRKK